MSAVTVAEHVSAAEVAQHDSDQPRVVAAAQRHDDRPITNVAEQASKDALVHVDEIAGQCRVAFGEERPVLKFVVPLQRRWQGIGETMPKAVAGGYLAQAVDKGP